MTSPGPFLVGSYDYSLVALSVLIAILASYAALDFAGRITSAHGGARLLWLNGGAIAMGFGVWSMHYVGMLAFRLPIPVQYDWPTVLLSLLAAILASAVALFVVSRHKMGWIRALLGSVLMGSGIAAMHYIGMAAMRLPAMCNYSTALVALSVVLAIVISLVALWLTFHLREDNTAWSWKKIVSALVMGAAIPVMHYTGMAAARFTPSTAPQHDLSHAVSVSSLSLAGIIIVTVVVLGFVPLASLRFDSLSNTRQLTARYFLFLGATSLLAILGTLLIQHRDQQSRSDARVVNIAGRQRMLSQAVAKEALLVTSSRDVNERQRLVEDLSNLESLWEHSHSALLQGDPALGVPGTNSLRVQKMFATLDPHYWAMAGATRALVMKVSGEHAPVDVSAETRSILAHEGPYLQAMDAIVFQYDREATARDDKKNQLHLGLLLSILGVLLLQGIVVLRPALARVQQGISQLVLAKQALHRKATFVELLQVVAVAANQATSAEEALQFSLDRVCEHTGWPVGHVYFCTPKTSTELISSTLWHFDSASQFETFRQVTASTPLAIGAGLPGRVVESGKPAWIVDINQDNNFPRRKVAHDLGVKGAFGFPVLVRGEVVAVLEFFSTNIEEPDDELLAVMSHVGAQLGQVVERTRVQQELARKAEALQESTARYRVVAEAATDAIVTIDSESRILFVNPATDRIFGYSSGEMLGHSLTMLMPESLLRRHQAGLKRYLETGEKHLNWQSVEITARHKSGREIPVEISFGEFVNDGVHVFTGILRDITERKRVAQELARHAEELARSNAELEQFAYVASHDLQEPLRMVASYTQLLAHRYKGKLDTDADEFIGFAVDGATRMQTLIQDLLCYSRVTTKGGSLQLTQTKAACDTALENLQASITESNAVVNVEPMPAVMADERQVAQLFQNLIGNALKYRDERSPEINVAAQSNGTEWIFSVRDNGIGIEPKYFDRIFQMFQRLHTRKEYSGTGIGLAICRKIVERHGGRIWVESQPGKGSTFLFTIPLAEGETNEVKAHRNSAGGR